MNVIVGLGNPGQTYRDTRHNVGFKVIETLSKRHKLQVRSPMVTPVDRRPACVYGEWMFGERTARLVMPLAMMNDSGAAFKALGSAPEQVLLVCDDVNLPLGMLRLRARGSAGGHLGLQSCLEVLGTEQVARLRIGIGQAQTPKDLVDFVLSGFESSERPVVKRMVEQAADACEAWVQDGIEVAMNRYNRTPGS